MGKQHHFSIKRRAGPVYIFPHIGYKESGSCNSVANWLLSFHRACSGQDQWAPQCGSVLSLVQSQKVLDFSRASLAHQGAPRTDDQKHMALWLSEKKSSLWIHSKAWACPVVFTRADISKRTPAGPSWVWKHQPILLPLIFCFIPSFHAVIVKNWQLNSIDSNFSGSIWPPTPELKRRQCLATVFKHLPLLQSPDGGSNI